MSIRVLIVDDEGDFIERVSFGLKGFDIVAAASVEEAKERMDESIDVIMLDLNLNPADDKMEGLERVQYKKVRKSKNRYNHLTDCFVCLFA